MFFFKTKKQKEKERRLKEQCLSSMEGNTGDDELTRCETQNRISLVNVNDSNEEYRVPMERYVIIGKNEAKCSLAIKDDPSVSGQHCKILLSEGFYILSDMDSTNGTKLNGKRINKPVPIENGDVIGIGRREFRFMH